MTIYLIISSLLHMLLEGKDIFMFITEISVHGNELLVQREDILKINNIMSN